MVVYTALMTLSSCATTTIYRNGRVVARLQGDTKNIVLEESADGGILLRCDEINHSRATMAQGEQSANRLTAVGSILTSVGLLKTLDP